MVLGSNGPYAASAPLRLRMGVDRGPREWPKRPEGLDGTTCPELATSGALAELPIGTEEADGLMPPRSEAFVVWPH